MRDVIDDSLASVRSLPSVLAMASSARTSAAQPVGSVPDRGRAVRRRAICAAGAPAGGEARRLDAGAAARGPRRARQPTERSAPARSARGAARRRPRQLGGIAGVGVRAARPPPGGTGAAARGRTGLRRRGRQGGAAGPPGADDRAAAAARAGADRGPDGARRRPGRRLPVARVPARGSVGARGEFRPERWLEGASDRRSEPGVVDPVRRRGPPLRRRAVRRDGDARGAARRRRPDAPSRPAAGRVGATEHARAGARTGAARCSPAEPTAPARRDSVHSRDAPDTRQHGPGGHAARARAGRARPARLHQPRPRDDLAGHTDVESMERAAHAVLDAAYAGGHPLFRRGALLRPGRGVPGELARAARLRPRRRHGRLEVGLHVHRRLARRRRGQRGQGPVRSDARAPAGRVAGAPGKPSPAYTRSTRPRSTAGCSTTRRSWRSSRSSAPTAWRSGSRRPGRNQEQTIERALEVGGFDCVQATWNLLERRPAPRWRRLTPRDWA